MHYTPSQWRKLAHADRLELLAYQQYKHTQRLQLLSEVIEKIPGEVGMLAQVLIEAME